MGIVVSMDKPAFLPEVAKTRSEAEQLWLRRKNEISRLTSVAEFLVWLKKEQSFHKSWEFWETEFANGTCLSLFVQALAHQSIIPTATDIAKLEEVAALGIEARELSNHTGTLVSNCLSHACNTDNADIVKDLQPLLVENQVLKKNVDAKIWEDCHIPELLEILPPKYAGGALDIGKLSWFKKQEVWTSMDLLQLTCLSRARFGTPVIRSLDYFYSSVISDVAISTFALRTGDRMAHPQENAIPFMELLDASCFSFEEREDDTICFASGVFGFLHMHPEMVKRLPWGFWERTWVDSGIMSKDALQREMLDYVLARPSTIRNDGDALSGFLAELLPRLTEDNFSRITLSMRQYLFTDEINALYRSEKIRRGLERDIYSAHPVKPAQL